MPTTLVLTFPWGRYHATPWDRHVNEGAVELPPSPWRVLRTLYAVWCTRAPELDADTVHDLLAALAAPPVFHLPRHGIAHTRHYYPDTKHGTDRTLDAFAVFERDAELAITWPVDLAPGQQAALARLAGSIPYFGRADSICTGAVVAGWFPDAHEQWVPLDVADTIAQNATVTSVLAPQLPLAIASLLATPAQVRRGGLEFPTGTHLVAYQRRTAALTSAHRAPESPNRTVTAVRFAALQTGLPPATDAVIYTDLLRQAALAKLGRLREERELTMLGGKTATSTEGRMRDQGHAHYLPLIEDRRLAGLLVWVPGRLPADEVKSLLEVTRLFSAINDKWRLSVRASGVGLVEDVCPELAAAHSTWISATPFAPSRYPKRRTAWPEFVAAEVRRELALRGISTDCEIETVEGEWTAFRRYRPSARQRHDANQGQARRSEFLRLRFDTPVPGPIALGYLSHFGLGLFTPELS
ncbi:type I-G CRISPR-associated protein Csb2 [Actinokineospora sp.]|uniref:type I-G CRISPR-associated protein Csb2 n=1 Tax=Actinokineospora sp. TaxID=1872133 RepID=UPI004037B000